MYEYLEQDRPCTYNVTWRHVCAITLYWKVRAIKCYECVSTALDNLRQLYINYQLDALIIIYS